MIIYLVLFAFLLSIMIIDPVKGLEILSSSPTENIQTQTPQNVQPQISSGRSFSSPFVGSSPSPSTPVTQESLLDNISTSIRKGFENITIFDDEEIDDNFGEEDSKTGFKFNMTNIIYILVFLLILFLVYYYRNSLWKLLTGWIPSSPDADPETTRKIEEEPSQVSGGPPSIMHPKIPTQKKIEIKEKICHPCPTCECPDCPECKCPECPECVCPDRTEEVKCNRNEIDNLKWLVRYLGANFRKEDAIRKAIRDQCPGIFAQTPDLDLEVQNNSKIINRDMDMSQYFQNYLSLYTGIPKDQVKKIL